jgi:hypothetical protein
MVYGDWVLFNDNVHKVSRQIGDRVYLFPLCHSYPFGHKFDISGVFITGDSEFIISFNKCIPITKEVADIMIAV